MPRPIVTATVQATGLAAISNFLAQGIQAYKVTGVVGPFALDWLELLRFMVLTILTAPPNYKWQQFLERSLPAYGARPASALPLTSKDAAQPSEKHRGEVEYPRDEGPPRLSIRNTLLKWFIDCITCGALMNTSAFLVLMGLLKGQGMQQIELNLRTQTFAIIWASYKIWPIASIISFSCVPVERRIVFLSCVNLCWGIYMSMVAARV